ncbi:MAG TPA: restriction endonuclease subunit S [Bacteroidales bacterium]|nr:restriction endonuclease subunit S [Bacteroidales bacterium]
MGWQVHKLGDLCNIEKGNIGITKAIAGEYPLVVLGEERKTHNEYQFEDDAVIIPLVSSTGHGHRSMKRIHFQSGKFALGSILCAVTPKDKSKVSAQYLFQYLDLNKENELVSRMRGMANVSLPMSAIADIDIPLPPFKEQIEIVERLGSLQKSNKAISDELSNQVTFLKHLRQQILQDAIQGKLVPQNPEDEPASKLLERIIAEKELLVKQKKIKKEKSLPPIKPEDIPFEIPDGWVWCRLSEVSNFIDYRGKTPNKVSAGIKLITAKNVKYGFYSTLPEEFISPVDYNKHMTRGIPRNGDILFTTEAPLGNACILNYDKQFALAQRIITIQPILFDNKFLLFSILSKTFQNQLIEKQSGLAAKGIKSKRLSEVFINLPPLPEQHRIVQKIDQLMKYCDELEATIQQNQNYTQELLQVALKEALEPDNL